MNNKVDIPTVGGRPLHEQRIMIVEDEYLLGISMYDELEAAGATVIGPVGSIDDALHVLASCEIDVAVLDVNLQGLHVYPVADVLRNVGVPFIFATGYEREFLPERYRSAPCVQKPLDLASLCGTIQDLIAPGVK
jgi:DNA-binding response OmpR family regulator